MASGKLTATARAPTHVCATLACVRARGASRTGLIASLVDAAGAAAAAVGEERQRLRCWCARCVATGSLLSVEGSTFETNNALFLFGRVVENFLLIKPTVGGLQI